MKKPIILILFLILSLETLAQRADLLLIDEDIDADQLVESFQVKRGSTLKSYLPPKDKRDSLLMEDIHRMSSVLTVDNLPRKTRLALEWAVAAQNQHLIYFQNPFEWHEVTAKVTAPEHPISLAKKIYHQKNNMTFSPGAFTPSLIFGPTEGGISL